MPDLNPPFTNEQQDWICKEIDKLYLEWKRRGHHSSIYDLAGVREELKVKLCASYYYDVDGNEEYVIDI